MITIDTDVIVRYPNSKQAILGHTKPKQLNLPDTPDSVTSTQHSKVCRPHSHKHTY